jgi:hypothetical protein
MLSFMCEYGNCEKEGDLPIIVSNKKKLERVRFCCQEHAVLYLLRTCNMADYNVQVKTNET